MHVVGYILISSLRHRGFRCSPFRDGSDATVRYKRKRGTACHVNPDVEKGRSKESRHCCVIIGGQRRALCFFLMKENQMRGGQNTNCVSSLLRKRRDNRITGETLVLVFLEKDVDDDATYLLLVAQR